MSDSPSRSSGLVVAAALALVVLGAGAYFFASQPSTTAPPAPVDVPKDFKAAKSPREKAQVLKRARQAREQQAEAESSSPSMGRAAASRFDPTEVRPSPPLGEPEKPVRAGQRVYPPIPAPPPDPDVSPAEMMEPVAQLFEGATEALDGCYEDSFDEPGAAGTAYVQFRVDEEGRARPLRVRTTVDLPDGDMIPCVSDIVGGFDFSAIPPGTRVSWPLSYSAEGLGE